ncbi:MAG: 1-phosphofructokinase [Lachnospiraceae bacterium]|nr:1-phosphofructokinase [Lachnospiraceae bacterium]
MIYTITFNPALDYIVSVRDYAMGKTNRTDEEEIMAGGKGVNVSIVSHNLGIENTALGFVAGFTGEEISRRLKVLGCSTDFIELPEGFSRINMKIKNYEGTEINGIGPVIDPKSLEKMLQKMDALSAGDILVLAGSIPASMPNSIYLTIMERLEGKGVEVVVDATKDLLLNVLPQQPFLIKPNNHELGEIFNVELSTRAEVIPYAKKLQELGARNVLVSMAGQGAVLVTEDDQIFEADAPKGTLVNGVGAGDSMVAGFLAGFAETKDYKEAFRMGVSAGSASAFSQNLASRQEIMDVKQRVQIS